MAGVAPHKEEIKELTEYLRTQVQKSTVRVVTGKEVTCAEILEQQPDAVIVATGASQAMPIIAGIDSARAVYAWDILGGRAEAGNRVVIIGGGMVGAETAEHLAAKGKKVTIVEMLPEIGTDMEPFSRTFLLERLRERGVKTLTSKRAVKLSGTGVQVLGVDGQTEVIDADTIVVAVGSKPNEALYSGLKGRVPELYRVGDCKQPRRILEALHEGTNAGCLV